MRTLPKAPDRYAERLAFGVLVAHFLETSAKTAVNVEGAFVNTAEKIYDNIEKGVYDVSNEAHGIKVGVTATNSARYMQKDGSGSGSKGGCC